MMQTEALILESSLTPFGKRRLLLFTPKRGKLLASCSAHSPSLFPPALVNVELIREKKGWYRIEEIEIERTFPRIGSSEQGIKSACLIAQLIRETMPLETASIELWELLIALLPCLHLFHDQSTGGLLVAFSLAIQQGIDLFDTASERLDPASKEALALVSTLDMNKLFTMKCPHQALQFVLEEIGIGKNQEEKKKSCERGDLNPQEETLTTTSK